MCVGHVGDDMNGRSHILEGGLGTLVNTCNVQFSRESRGFQTQVRARSISTNEFSMSRVLAMPAV